MDCNADRLGPYDKVCCKLVIPAWLTTETFFSTDYITAGIPWENCLAGITRNVTKEAVQPGKILWKLGVEHHLLHTLKCCVCV
jgi:hypothetical protein